ncbi:AAA family ATPase [Agrobacterium fabrum]|uniref:AAA family ATPase n=1 Tax=Agrobacterium fabrum TaxID=1176649 RepID=UPI0015735D3F|nr:AAA family ATPase [Agrobacterium fabrum]WCK79888.1 AAA family ATPase [Agrobacterium fabrum]
MEYDKFREWLRARGGNSNSINTRSTAVRKIETEMAALGSPHTDLDAAYDDDQFAQLKQALDDMRLDVRNGGERFRILFPGSQDPLNRIANSRAWLGQYGQYRGASNQPEYLGLRADETYWFVGGSFGGTDDQVQRFLTDNVWEIRTPKDDDAAAVRSMQVGDRIAIKAAFVQRLNLPFDNRGHWVSVMRLKARGVVTANPGDGERVSVSWDKEFEPKDWYFYTYRPTIWEVHPGNELADRLIAFAFLDDPQDIDWFRNHVSWSKLFADNAEPSAPRFWIEKTIVAGRPDREVGENALGRVLWSPQRSKDGKNIYSNMLQVQPGDVVFHLTDNEAISSVSVASSAADRSFVALEGSEWAGQPAFRIELKEHEVLEPQLPRSAFLETEPFSAELKELAESGAKGLFYNSHRGLNQGAYLTEATPTLLAILNRAYQAFAGRGLPYLAADAPSQEAEAVIEPYTLDDALEALFLDRSEAEDILLLWAAKKNIILQGPPGVGKSFAAQKLAFALMGAEDRSRFGFVQFHQSYSYEDFVEGFRPTSTGFELRPGKFVEFCRLAEADPNQAHVFVIDEINRGNLSKILGELMLLIESDKRDPKWAMPLASGKVPFHVPSNVHVMGLMNTADRSLAVVDYALRRRFAFVNVAPNLKAPKFREQLTVLGVGQAVIDTLINRVELLNKDIVDDVANLGPGFAIGHSFFCAGPMVEESDVSWFARVIRTEILPLLLEYWFDAPSKVDRWEAQLLAPL